MFEKMKREWNNKLKYYTLDDGRIVTRQELSKLTGLSPKTIWLRLKTTRNYEELSIKRKVGGQRKVSTPKKRVPNKTAFQDTYGDMPPELFKLLFGKW